jgi:hypothetical protein
MKLMSSNCQALAGLPNPAAPKPDFAEKLASKGCGGLDLAIQAEQAE